MTHEHAYLPRLKRQLSDGEIDRRSFLRTATLLGMSASVAYAFAGLPAPAKSSEAMPKGGTLRVGLPIHAIDNPHALNWGDGANMMFSSLEYLTRTDADNITRPFLLESWEPSDDLRSWTLKLKPGIRFRKGDELVADHVIWNLKDVLDPNTGSSVLGLMKDYMLNEIETGELDSEGNPQVRSELWDASAIEKIDDHTVRLNLKQPQLAVPEHLYHYPMMILHPDDYMFNVGMDGTGAYVLTEYENGRNARLERTDGYWRGNGFAHLDAIEYIDLGDDANARVAAMASAQVDALHEITEVEARTLRQAPGLTIYSATSGATMVARMRSDKEPFSDPRVRLAFKLAADIESAMAAGALGNGTLAEHHHVCPIHPEYAELPPMNRDVERARELLAAAGYPDGLDVQITVKNAPSDEGRVAEALIESWAEAGIRCGINMVPSATYWEAWTELDFGITNWGHRPLGVMVLALAYRSGVPWNESHYSNPEFDRLLTEAEAVPDPSERSEIMAKIQKIMQDDGPIVQPYWQNIQCVFNDRVLGARMHPSKYIFPEELAVSDA